MNLYQQEILDHYHNPRNAGRLSDFTHSFELENLSCGDSVEVFLQVEGNEIKQIGYEVEGCAICIASTSKLSEQLIGKTIDQVEQLNADYMLELLGINLTTSRIKCATLPLDATKSAFR